MALLSRHQAALFSGPTPLVKSTVSPLQWHSPFDTKNKAQRVACISRFVVSWPFIKWKVSAEIVQTHKRVLNVMNMANFVSRLSICSPTPARRLRPPRYKYRFRTIHAHFGDAHNIHADETRQLKRATSGVGELAVCRASYHLRGRPVHSEHLVLCFCVDLE